MREAATGINSWKNESLTVVPPRYFVIDPQAAIIKIRKV